MDTCQLLDGQLHSDALADDRGLHYGDGVFETMAWQDGEIRFFERHLARLRRGCRALGFSAPDEETLRSDLDVLALPSEDCVVKLVVTRGSGGKGYRPESPAEPRRLFTTRLWPVMQDDTYSRGIVLTWLGTVLANQPMLAGIKHLCRLEQVLAARELADTDADEGLVCDRAGAVIEAVSANVFMTRDSRLLTPLLNECGVAGIMREVVIEAAGELGIECEERVLRRADFAYADEVFLTSSIRGLVPVRVIDRLEYPDRDVATRISSALKDTGLVPCG